jgi:hypothetical protein
VFSSALRLRFSLAVHDSNSSDTITRIFNNLNMPDIDCIHEHIAIYPGVKVCFAIYRLTYSDDARWARFMHYLNTRVRLNFEEQGNDDVFPHIDWDVQEDPELEDVDE